MTTTAFTRPATCLFLFMALAGFCTAQSVEEVKAVFPDADIVYQQYDQELNLYIKDGIPVADRTTTIEFLMLTEKNINMVSRWSVYHSGYSELTDLEAYTKIPSGNKYKHLQHTERKTSTSSQDNVFYDDSKETTFTFPGLTQHAIAHVNYTQFHKDAHLMGAYYLPGYLPVMQSSFTVTVPNGMNIRYHVRNDPNGKFILTTEKKKKETIYKWTINKVKPELIYGNAPDNSYYQPHIIVHITDYETKEGKKTFLNTLDDLYNWNYSFLKDLNKTSDPSLKLLVDSLTAGTTSQMQKARNIYKWVQQNIKYVAFENGLEGFRPRQASEVCFKRYGDCKDMSSIITQMLQIAGIKAYYTWIGTRDLPYNYSETPLPIVDNHMISTAYIDGKWIFLDGTDNNASFDMPPAFIHGKEALLSISSNEYKVLTVPIAKPEESLIVDSTFISITNDGVVGYEKVHYNGFFGKEIYSSLLYKDKTDLKDYVNSRMSKGSNKFILGEYSITRSSPEHNKADITAKFQLPGYSKKVGDEYYINLHLEKLLENQVIDLEKRKIPLESNFNYSIHQYHILDIPEGYKVTYLPKDFNFENDMISIRLYYKIVNQQVIAAQEIQHKQLLIEPAQFAEWNKPMKAVLPHYKESVVLQKK